MKMHLPTFTFFMPFAVATAIVFNPFSFLSQKTYASGSCLHSLKGPIVVDIKECSYINGLEFFKKNKAKHEWAWNIPPKEKAKNFAEYTGMISTAVVIKSEARRSNLLTQESELTGTVKKIFIPSGKNQCQAIQNMRIQGNVYEECCDGRYKSPCLYKMTFRLHNHSVVGKAIGSTGNPDKVRAAKNPNYRKAVSLFRNKKYAAAAKNFELARKSNAIDTAGYYYLALSYYNLERCPNAIKTLTPIRDSWEQGKHWASQENIVRKGVFLLARCYSITSNPQSAAVILNAYLADPRKYKSEIHSALRHKDFGWIRSSHEFRQFSSDANNIKY